MKSNELKCLCLWICHVLSNIFWPFTYIIFLLLKQAHYWSMISGTSYMLLLGKNMLVKVDMTFWCIICHPLSLSVVFGFFVGEKRVLWLRPLPPLYRVPPQCVDPWFNLWVSAVFVAFIISNSVLPNQINFILGGQIYWLGGGIIPPHLNLN